MKIKNLLMLATVLSVGSVAVSAKSYPAGQHVSNAGSHSIAASTEAVQAVGESGQAVVKTGAGVVAVPVFLSGTAVAATGEIVSLTGKGVRVSGEAAIKGGEKIWDFATGDPAKRPAYDRRRALPPSRKALTAQADPAPGEILRQQADR